MLDFPEVVAMKVHSVWPSGLVHQPNFDCLAAIDLRQGLFRHSNDSVECPRFAVLAHQFPHTDCFALVACSFKPGHGTTSHYEIQ